MDWNLRHTTWAGGWPWQRDRDLWWPLQYPPLQLGLSSGCPTFRPPNPLCMSLVRQTCYMSGQPGPCLLGWFYIRVLKEYNVRVWTVLLSRKWTLVFHTERGSSWKPKDLDKAESGGGKFNFKLNDTLIQPIDQSVKAIDKAWRYM